MLQFHSIVLLLLCFSAVAFFSTAAASGGKLSLEFHHRFSEPVRKWTESRTPGGSSPARMKIDRRSVEYYATLVKRDRALSGRGLLEGDKLAFAGGNATVEIDSLGFLHYAMVTVGTPRMTFMVALDTGSDIFWVPCECIQCAATTASLGNDFEFNIYSPDLSSTSKRVPCNSRLCGTQNDCSVGSHCNYKIDYVSADTSSSGILIEDVLYLTKENGHSEIVQAPIIFGCGRIQTGSFLDVAAPNGLLGLGMEKISVPSMLAGTGLTSNSFSMCFGHDGVGRITFGDRGSSDQEETPFGPSQHHPTYNINVTEVSVANNSVNTEFGAIFDSGTSFTYLADPAYTSLCQSFDAQVQDKRHSPDSRIPFEFCYVIRTNSTRIPLVTLTMQGGSRFPVTDPVMIISLEANKSIYCLAVVKSNQLNIIGQNFMTGHRIVFDRERMILGWKLFNCYDMEDTNYLPVSSRNSSTFPPKISVGPSNYNPEESKEKKNNSQIAVLTPPASLSSQLNCFPSITVILLSLFIL